MLQDKWAFNQKISQLRDEWDIEQHRQGWWSRKYSKDWTLDRNWPTLFREICDGDVNLWREFDTLWGCFGIENQEIGAFAADIGQAVCMAWLRWKGVECNIVSELDSAKSTAQ